ncbi:MAG: FAD-dependent oxidoreductase, partial [Acidimicrobiales bacterium]
MSRTPDADADVVVVGGGPAGAAAALTHARHGRRVSVVDRARVPRVR